MKVETFEIERSNELVDAANDGMAQEMIEKLGLTGQARFYKEDTLEAIPYRKMTKDEALVYGYLMPKKCTPEEYSDGLIPIRVLQVIEHAKSLEFFDALKIWYPENADIKDPVLVGEKKVDNFMTKQYGSQYFDTEIYFLARWGEVLDTFSALRECAKAIWSEKALAAIIEIESEVSAYKDALKRGAVSLEKGMPSFHK